MQDIQPKIKEIQENIKISHLLNKEYLQKVLHKGNGIMKIEYSKRTENIYKLMNVVAVEWDESGIPLKVMMISQDIGKRHELENLANTDGLTGLFNERYFSSVLHRKEKKKLPFVLYYLDLDHFKPVNDTYGHAVGDKVLHRVGEFLKNQFRDDDIIGRVGGDEFVILMKQVSSRDAALSRVQSMLEHIRSVKHAEMNGQAITFSVGVAFSPEQGTRFDDLYRNADKALYQTSARTQ